MQPLLRFARKLCPQPRCVQNDVLREIQHCFHVVAFEFGVTFLHFRQGDLLVEFVELPLVGLAVNRLFVDEGFFEAFFLVVQLLNVMFQTGGQRDVLCLPFFPHVEHNFTKQLHVFRLWLHLLQKLHEPALQFHFANTNFALAIFVLTPVVGVTLTPSFSVASCQRAAATSALYEMPERKIGVTAKARHYANSLAA
ncbi:MAG: hypothetical protein ABSH11_02600 [Verrucomicrobiota bacterium]